MVLCIVNVIHTILYSTVCVCIAPKICMATHQYLYLPGLVKFHKISVDLYIYDNKNGTVVVLCVRVGIRGE